MFIVGFVVIYLVIAVIRNDLEQARTEQLRELQTLPGRNALVRHPAETQQALDRLRRRLESSER